MANYIAILEDNPQRISRMRLCLEEGFPQFQHRFFERAGEMIEWLGENMGDTVLISLDHDLPEEGAAVNTGRMVADWLAGRPPACPVIVHSSNDPLALGMLRALRDAKWPCWRCYPRDEYEWIQSDWARGLAELQRKGLIG